jgi:hypothetical protein
MEKADLEKKLEQYEANLAAVEAALAQQPDNEQYKNLRWVSCICMHIFIHVMHCCWSIEY